MTDSISFYKRLPINTLEKSTEQAGLGVESPLDLEVITKIIAGLKSILEIGCGTGRVGKFLINPEYVGIEPNKEYISKFIENVDEKYKYNIICSDY